MWKIFTKNLDLKSEISKLKKEVADRDNLIKSLATDIEGLEKLVNKKKEDVYGPIDKEREKLPTPILDFSNIDCFSVERNDIGTESEETAIGYWKVENETKVAKEWHYYISRKSHEEILEQFKAYLEKKRCEN